MLKETIVEKVLKHVVIILLPIYVWYFEWETKKSTVDPIEIAKGSETDLYWFLWEFDICPSLISKSMVSDVWTQVIEKSLSGKTPIYWETAMKITHGGKHEGRIFTFGFFLDLIVLITQIIYVDEDPLKKLNVPEGLCLLLERMELSKGFINF